MCRLRSCAESCQTCHYTPQGIAAVVARPCTDDNDSCASEPFTPYPTHHVLGPSPPCLLQLTHVLQTNDWWQYLFDKADVRAGCENVTAVWLVPCGGA